jgi:hypothetical protein
MPEKRKRREKKYNIPRKNFSILIEKKKYVRLNLYFPIKLESSYKRKNNKKKIFA